MHTNLEWERNGLPICWLAYASRLHPCRVVGGQPYSFHTGGVMISLCDGSARLLSDSVELTTFLNLMLRDDRQVLGEF